MKERRNLVDTSLRDGEQCPGIVFRPEDKILIANLLDEIGVYEIEVGISNKETEGTYYIEQIMKQRKNAKISIWSRMNLDDLKHAIELKPDLIHIGVPVSYVQIYSKLKKNKAWVMKQLVECMEFAAASHIPIVVGFEDSSRADVGFLISLAKQIHDLDGQTIRLADTVGILSPLRAGQFAKELLSQVSIKIQAHEHNDLGMAVGNSVAMIRAGAQLVDCTLFGMGERAGNCNMYEFLSATEFFYDFGIRRQKVREVEAVMLDLLKERLPEEEWSDYQEIYIREGAVW